MDICYKCQSELLDTIEKCLTCGRYIGPPNVRSVDKIEERLALEYRYKNTVSALSQKGALEPLSGVEEALKTSSAVLCVSLDFLSFFLSYRKSLYSTYALSVEGETRMPATEADESHRLSVDALLFAGYGKHIRFAALSLDGLGPKSYGPYSIKLREVAIEDRATLLEENSYRFVPKHNVGSNGGIPAGHRATWRERHKLAVCKLAERIASGDANDLPKALLSSNGDYATDDFIEVHIYGPFDANAIESVKGISVDPDEKQEYAMLERVKELLKNAGKDWVEE
ncbi:MAG TPA: hypothetical protein VKA70_17650 [Blastocatellia bacterium]|nr:hypothetical protein [Blastocatellia bacterium]